MERMPMDAMTGFEEDIGEFSVVVCCEYRPI